eukprot:652786-Pyramimonas_sp.AAC.1
MAEAGSARKRHAVTVVLALEGFREDAACEVVGAWAQARVRALEACIASRVMRGKKGNAI